MKAEGVLKKYLGGTPDGQQKPVWDEIVKAMEEYHQSQLQALKEEVEKLDYESRWADGQEPFLIERKEVLNLITSLEDNG